MLITARKVCEGNVFTPVYLFTVGRVCIQGVLHPTGVGSASEGVCIQGGSASRRGSASAWVCIRGCWVGSPRILRGTIDERAICILLECFLVFVSFRLPQVLNAFCESKLVCIFTACQRSCGKVMFSVASVCQLGKGTWGVPCDRYPWCIIPHDTEKHQARVPLQTWDLAVKGPSCPSPPPDMEPKCTGTIIPASDIWVNTGSLFKLIHFYYHIYT